jgi:hypothetical protein
MVMMDQIVMNYGTVKLAMMGRCHACTIRPVVPYHHMMVTMRWICLSRSAQSKSNKSRCSHEGSHDAKTIPIHGILR